MAKVCNLYNSKVLLVLLIGLLGLILCPAYVNAAPNPGHSAGEIGAGTFYDSSPYTFPQNLIVSGNLGLGASPGSKLDVRGITQITDDSATPDTSTYASFGVTRAAAVQNNAYIGLTKQGTVPWGIGIDSGSSLIFGVAVGGRTIPTPRLTLTQGGNFGIGTTGPSQALDVAGNINLENTSLRYLYLGSGGGYLKTGNAAGGGILLEAVNSPGVYINSVSNKPVILATGGSNVGIGTANPTSGMKLTVNGDTEAYQNIYVRGALGSTAEQFRIHDNNADIYLDYNGGNVYWRDEGSTNTVTIQDGTGNVGIGATSPGAKLDVKGQILIDADDAPSHRSLLVQNDGTSVDSAVVLNDNTASNRWRHLIFEVQGSRAAAISSGGTAASNKLYLASSLNGQPPSESTADMTIDSAGNVGIGTTGPDAKLHVIGSICAESSDTGCAPTSGYVRGAGLCIGTDCKTSWPSGVGGSGTANYLSKWTAGTTLGNSLVYETVASPNWVDIGPDGSTTNLVVRGGVTIDSPGSDEINIESLSGETGMLTFTDQFNRLEYTYGSGGPLKIRGYNGLQMYNYAGEVARFGKSSSDLSSYFNGNVGIGTTSPGTKLDVIGDIYTSTDVFSPHRRQNLITGKTFTYAGTWTSTGAIADGNIDTYSAGNAGATIEWDLDYCEKWSINGGTIWIIPEGYWVGDFAGGNFALDVYNSTTGTWQQAGTFSSNGLYAFNNPVPYNINPSCTKLRIRVINPGRIAEFQVWGNLICGYTNNIVSGKAVFGGNVGIGTTSPGDKLHVVGNIRIDSVAANNIRFANNAGNTGGMVWGSTGYSSYYSRIYDDGQLYISSDDNIIFSGIDTATGAKGTEWMRVASGNVGIGTTTPTNKLTVAGDVNSTGSMIFYNELMPDGATCSNGQILKKTAANDWDCVADDTGTGGGGWTEDAANNKVYVTNTGRNVGIGTTGPHGKLELYDAAQPTGHDLILSRFWGGTDNVRGSSVFHYYDATSKDILVFGVAGDIAGGGASYTSPNTLAAARMVIQPSGNVGIGTTSPSEKLHVAGDILIGGANLKMDTSLRTLSVESGGAQDNYLHINAFGDHPGVKVNQNAAKPFDVNGGQFYVSSTGNVGIGTASPQSKLHVNGEAGVLNLEGSTHAYIQWYPDGYAAGRKGWTGWENGAAIDFTIANEYSGGDIILSPNTNVGIGTTSPGYKLDVSGDIRSTGAVRAGNGGFGFAPNGNSWTGFDLQGAGKRVILGIDASSSDPVFDIEKVDSGWQHMMELRKDGGAYFAGSVGIGTSTPDDKLEVIGSVTSDFADNGGEGAYYFGNTNHGISRNNQNTVSIFTSNGGSEGAIRLNTDGVTRIFVANGSAAGDGKVGIGTTSPGSKLHVFGGGSYPALLLVERDGYSGNNRIAAFKGNQVRAVFDGPDGDPVGVGLEFAESGNSLFSTTWNSFNNRFEMTNYSNTNYGIWIYPSVSPTYRLDVLGVAHATSFPASSDIRFKTNITQLTNVLEKVEKIHGVSFEWNKLYESMGRSSGHREIGVIAQEVEAVFPELVTNWGDNNENYKAVDYGRMTGVLVEAVKELKAENDALKQRIEALERGANVKV